MITEGYTIGIEYAWMHPPYAQYHTQTSSNGPPLQPFERQFSLSLCTSSPPFSLIPPPDIPHSILQSGGRGGRGGGGVRRVRATLSSLNKTDARVWRHSICAATTNHDHNNDAVSIVHLLKTREVQRCHKKYPAKIWSIPVVEVVVNGKETTPYWIKRERAL